MADPGLIGWSALWNAPHQPPPHTHTHSLGFYRNQTASFCYMTNHRMSRERKDRNISFSLIGLCFLIRLFHSHKNPDSLPQGSDIFLSLARLLALALTHTHAHIHKHTHILMPTWPASLANVHIPTDALTLPCAHPRAFPRTQGASGNAMSLAWVPLRCSGPRAGTGGESGKELEKHPGSHISIFLGL